jgi:hypothetical protein
MIVTKHFVYIHTSRTAGTFLNKLILEHVPGAQMLQYHGQLKDLPEACSHLPVIGFVRNPWDWYISMFSDYRRKQQYVYEIISEGSDIGFEETTSRFLRLGDNSEQSRKLLAKLVDAAPAVINSQTPRRLGNPGLRSEQFAAYPENFGYYSWLTRTMFESKKSHRVHIGRFEDLRDEALRLLTITRTPITKGITSYLDNADALNSSPRPTDIMGAYPPELELLVADKEKYLIDKFGYEFSEPHKYPKTDFFNHLGTADVNALKERVTSIPDSIWKSENEDKPNKFARLNDTRHIIFRYINADNVFDFHDLPLWDEWKDMLLPIMEQAANSLGYKDYRFPRAMFAWLPVGGEISIHSDGNASHYIHKIHVPLITNSDTIFHVGRQEKHLPEGEIIEVNNKRTHSVKNDGDQDRIHFIFECYSMADYGKAD